jgi:hypothetical protein
LCLALAASAYAQVVYLPVSNEVYDFLKRMSSKRLLTNYMDAEKPLSRMYIAKELRELEDLEDQMTSVERETYDFYVAEFRYEILKLAGDNEPSEMRWHVLSRELNEGLLNLDIDYKFSHELSGGVATDIYTKGLRLDGYAFNSLGFYFNVDDNKEIGNRINYFRLHTPDKGVINSGGSLNLPSYSLDADPLASPAVSELDYDEIDAQLTYQIGKVVLSFEKSNNIWGYGENGNVILSNKAPSYPQVKIRVPLSDNIEFVYFHGELNSNVTDSSRSYTTVTSASSVFRNVDHMKYIAAHQLEFMLWKGVDVSLGESVIYSDRGPLLMYMIPVMFFKAGEHYNGDKDNCQMFGSLDLNLIKNTDLYFSLFIDELNTDKLFDTYASHRQIAFTIGGHTYDVLLENLEISAEYSRVNPGAYNHKYQTTTYTNNGYVMGHWIGQNADDCILSLAYRPVRELKFGAYSEIYRKGDIMPISDQYSADQGEFSFLQGKRHEEKIYGIKAHYQPLRDLFFDAKAQLHTLTDESDPTSNYDERFELFVSASLGIW